MRSSALKWNHEQACQRAAVERLQHRRLDLDNPLNRGSGGSRDPRAPARPTRRAAGVNVRSSSRWRSRASRVRQAVVLLGRRARRLASSVQSSTLTEARRGRLESCLRPRAGRRVGREQALERLSPSTSRRACSWIRPLRSSIRTPSCPGRGGRAGGRPRHARRSPRRFESRGAPWRRRRCHPSRRAGTGRSRPRSPSSLRRRTARAQGLARLELMPLHLGDRELALLPAREHHRALSPFLRPTAPCRRATRSSRLADGSASVEPTIVYVGALPLSSLTWTWEPTRRPATARRHRSPMRTGLVLRLAMRDSSLFVLGVVVLGFRRCRRTRALP